MNQVVSGQGDLTGKIATFKIMYKNLPQFFCKYGLHMIKVVLREESIAICAVTQLEYVFTCFEGVTQWLSNLCFRGKKWRENFYFVKIYRNCLDLFQSIFVESCNTLHTFDRADRTTERGISKN